jgi:hypothetical protein
MIPALPKVVNGCQRMPALSQALRAEAAKTDKRIKLQRIPQLSGLGGAPQEESSSMCCFSAFLAKHLAICDTCIPFGPRVPTGRDGLRRSLSRRSRCFASADERPAICEASCHLPGRALRQGSSARLRAVRFTIPLGLRVSLGGFVSSW